MAVLLTFTNSDNRALIFGIQSLSQDRRALARALPFSILS
jgi:hypothetical protein